MNSIVHNNVYLPNMMIRKMKLLAAKFPVQASLYAG